MVESFAELRRGETLTLGSGGKVTLLRYSDCAAIEVVGGEIVGGDKGVDLRNATVAGETNKQCPSEITVRSDAVMGGVVVRGGDLAHHLPQPISVRPSFVFPGPLGQRVYLIEVREKGRAVARVRARGRRVVWPKDVAALKPGSSYELVVRLDEAAGTQRTAKVSPKEGAQTLSVIRIDPAR